MNNSNKDRRIIYVTYNKLSEGDQRTNYFKDKRKEFPPDIEREAGLSTNIKFKREF